MSRFVFIALISGALAAPLLAAPSDKPASKSAPTTRPAKGAISEVRFDGTPLSDVFDYIIDSSGINMAVNWKALEAAGVSRDTPITLRVRDVTLRKLLDMVLKQAGGADGLTWEVEDNVLEITTRAVADKHLVTRVYGIQDLLFEATDFEAPTNLNYLTDSGTTGSASGGATVGSTSSGSSGNNNGLFGSTNDSNQTDQNKASSSKDRAEEIIKLIKKSIRPDIWDDNGGPGSIKFFRGNLIVTAPQAVHRQIGRPTR